MAYGQGRAKGNIGEYYGTFLNDVPHGISKLQNKNLFNIIWVVVQTFIDGDGERYEREYKHGKLHGRYTFYNSNL